MQEQLFKIRDKRQDSRFYIDNEVIDGYAKYIGIHALGIYVALARHSKNESCFLYQKTLAYELGISIDTIGRGTKILREYNMISVEMKTKTKKGRGSNVYYLLDRKEWKPVPNWSNQPKEYRPFKNVSVASTG